MTTRNQGLSIAGLSGPALNAAGVALGLGLAAAVVAAATDSIAFLPLRAPDLSLIAAEELVVQAHLGAAVTALLVGLVLLAGRKGRTMHRVLGWTWVVAMATTALSSFFIQRINPGSFSLIHALSGWTVVALPMAVYAARRHRIVAHRRAMTGMFVGGLLVAGGFAFMPGRLMWRVFFG